MTMTIRSRLFQSERTKRYLRQQKLMQITVVALATIAVWLLMVCAATKPAHANGIINCDLRGCRGEANAVIYIHKRVKHEARARFDANGNSDAVIGGRPIGCPPAYCGCGLARYLGLRDPRLNLAWNWARLFPRTHAHAGAAAVRRHHVMLLVAQISGSIWTVRDYNGGRHLSYIHERDVSGYMFVEPIGGKFASAF